MSGQFTKVNFKLVRWMGKTDSFRNIVIKEEQIGHTLECVIWLNQIDTETDFPDSQALISPPPLDYPQLNSAFYS